MALDHVIMMRLAKLTLNFSLTLQILRCCHRNCIGPLMIKPRILFRIFMLSYCNCFECCCWIKFCGCQVSGCFSWVFSSFFCLQWFLWSFQRLHNGRWKLHFNPPIGLKHTEQENLFIIKCLTHGSFDIVNASRKNTNIPPFWLVKNN